MPGVQVGSLLSWRRDPPHQDVPLPAHTRFPALSLGAEAQEGQTCGLRCLQQASGHTCLHPEHTVAGVGQGLTAELLQSLSAYTRVYTRHTSHACTRAPVTPHTCAHTPHLTCEHTCAPVTPHMCAHTPHLTCMHTCAPVTSHACTHATPNTRADVCTCHISHACNCHTCRTLHAYMHLTSHMHTCAHTPHHTHILGKVLLSDSSRGCSATWWTKKSIFHRGNSCCQVPRTRKTHGIVLLFTERDYRFNS